MDGGGNGGGDKNGRRCQDTGPSLDSYLRTPQGDSPRGGNAGDTQVGKTPATDIISAAAATILLVDDRTENLQVLFELLREAGHRVLVATSGDVALERAERTLPELILLDVMMVGLDGFEVCQLLKSNAKTCDIPVIFLTALHDVDNRLRGFELGGVDYITKPIFSPCEVLMRVELHVRLRREMLRRQAAEAQLRSRQQDLQRQVRDCVAELERARRERNWAARRDRLTGLPNRAWLEGCIQGLLDEAAGGQPCAVVMLALERFQVLVTSQGWAFGETLLTQVAERLLANLPPLAEVARTGDTEFVLVLRGGASPEVAAAIARRMGLQLEQPFQVADQTVHLGVRAGVAVAGTHCTMAEELLRDALLACRQARRTLTPVQVFAPAMRTALAARLTLERDLRQAIAEEALTVYYQPIVNLETGALERFEALVRWFHPERGAVSPGHFIPIAEESQTIDQLGRQVRDRVCQDLARWRSPDGLGGPSDRASGRQPCGDLPIISVNLSPLELRQTDLVDQIGQTLDRWAIAPHHLALELTETRLLGLEDPGMAQLRGLREAGLRLYLDDFGTGYSSLARLHELPVTTLKLDRSFLQRPSGVAAAVRMTLDLALNLGLEAIFEGIETEGQAQELRQLGGRLGQGFWFAPPLDFETARSRWWQDSPPCPLGMPA